MNKLVNASEPQLLMTPGPTRVPGRVLAAGARPMIHHRSPEFSKELRDMIALLGPIFGTAQPILPVHTTGRGALEASLCNLFSPGDEIAFCCNGIFGEMWAAVAASYGLIVHRICADWEHDVDPADVDAFLTDHPGVRAVAMTYCDTSTGVANDVSGVGDVVRRHDRLLMIDGVSSIGGMPFSMDEWGVDVAVTASQKCLMSSPGLAFAVLSERAWAATKQASLPRNYWEFSTIRRDVGRDNPETPGTTPVHLVLQVAEALRAIHEEGLPEVYARHERLAMRTRAGIEAFGFSIQCPDLGRYSPTLTAIRLADGVDPRALRKGVKARGIVTAAALGPYEPNCFRIGHMGDIRATDVERTLAAVSVVLDELSTSVSAR